MNLRLYDMEKPTIIAKPWTLKGIQFNSVSSEFEIETALKFENKVWN